MSEAADAADRLHGHCLCGGITLSLPGDMHAVHACHCGACRRSCSGPAMVLPAGEDLRIECGDALVRRFASSAWLERAFCSVCGSSLFLRSTGDGQHYVAAGLFDSIPGVRFECEIFIDAKPDWYALDGPDEHLTGEAFFARIGAA